MDLPLPAILIFLFFNTFGNYVYHLHNIKNFPLCFKSFCAFRIIPTTKNYHRMHSAGLLVYKNEYNPISLLTNILTHSVQYYIITDCMFRLSEGMLKSHTIHQLLLVYTFLELDVTKVISGNLHVCIMHQQF